MTPVDQTSFGSRDGNCFAASVASILEIPISEVPDLRSDASWWRRFEAWVRSRGLVATIHDVSDPRADLAPPGYSIACGPSPRYREAVHATVALDGRVVHDPHPDRSGLRQIDRYITLEES